MPINQATQRWACLAATLCYCATAGHDVSAQLLRDDFDGGTLDTTLWRIPDNGPGAFLGRTQLETSTLPAVGGGVATLGLDTHNPSAPGTLFRGSEIITNDLYARNEGLIFEARTRLVAPTQGGLVGSLFSYDVFGGIRDEIDFELLSNDVVTNTQRVLTNVFQDDPFTGPGSGGDSAFVGVPGIDLTQFNTYRIAWLPDRLDWFVNDVLVRRTTNDLPDDPMSIRLNLWAPDSGFGSAFNAALQPAASPAANQTYFYEIDYVEISRPGGTPSLSNAGFEDLGGTLSGWTEFGNTGANVSVQSEAVLEGDHALKLYGQFNGTTNYSGVSQGIAVSGGDLIRAQASSFIRSQDSIVGTGNSVEMKIEFYRVLGGAFGSPDFLSETILEIADGSSAQDAWLEHVLTATAPADAVEARLSFVFVQPAANAGGAVHLDAARLDVVPVLPGDANRDGVVNHEDLELVLIHYGQSATRGGMTADLSGPNGEPDGVIGADDLDAVLARWSPNQPQRASQVPEPAAALVLILPASLACRRRRVACRAC